MSSSSPPIDDQSHIIRNLNICLITFSTAIIAIRCYVRAAMIKSVGWDDAFAIVAWAFVLVMSSLEIVESELGTGKHVEDIPLDQLIRFYSTLPTMELMYFVAICFVRLSIIAVLPRISREQKINRFVWGLGTFVVLLSAVSFMVLLFECKYVPDLWNKTNPTAQCQPPAYESHLFWTSAGIGLCVDLVLFIVPIWLIYSRMVFSLAALKVILVFSVGLFVIVTGLVRLVIIVSIDFTVDTTYKFVKLSTWADLEVHIGLWVACFPSLTPLIRMAAKRIGMPTRSIGSDNKANHPWENKARGYVKSGTESQLRHEHSSVFEDDASTKKIVQVDERHAAIEMGQIRVNTKVVMVDERDVGTNVDGMLSTKAYANSNRGS